MRFTNLWANSTFDQFNSSHNPLRLYLGSQMGRVSSGARSPHNDIQPESARFFKKVRSCEHTSAVAWIRLTCIACLIFYFTYLIIIFTNLQISSHDNPQPKLWRERRDLCDVRGRWRTHTKLGPPMNSSHHHRAIWTPQLGTLSAAHLNPRSLPFSW